MDEHHKTIVGGRGDKRPTKRTYPRGIEILLKKANTDNIFCDHFLANPIASAASIEVDLTPGERAVLIHTPRSMLRNMITNTRVPKRHVRAFRMARTATTLAAVLAYSVSAPGIAAADSGVTDGVMAGPLDISDPTERAVEQMYVIQDMLDYYHSDHGNYPTTEEWLSENNPLYDYLERPMLRDPWHDLFHYQGVMEQGVVVNYRLESKGEDLGSRHDDITCPADPAAHSFDGPNPLSVAEPIDGGEVELQTGAEGEVLPTSLQAAHDNPRVIVTWLLDGKEVARTIGEHVVELVLNAGRHEMLLRDENENEQMVTFTAVQQTP